MEKLNITKFIGIDDGEEWRTFAALWRYDIYNDLLFYNYRKRGVYPNMQVLNTNVHALRTKWKS